MAGFFGLFFGAIVVLSSAALAADSSAGYDIDGLALRYRVDDPALPRPAALMSLKVPLTRIGANFGAPDENGAHLSLPLSELAAVQGHLSPGALLAIDAEIATHMRKLGFYGVFVAPAADEIDPDTGDDLRKADNKTLHLVISLATVAQVRTIASGNRIGPDQGIDNPAHQRIRENSPIQPATTQAAGQPSTSNTLLQRDALNDYALRLDRYPGRHVDVAIAAAEQPDQAVLDYLVSENRPLSVYTGISNTGTKATNEYRERLGFIWTQFTGRDDTLSLDYDTASFKSESVAATYDAPLMNSDRTRWRVLTNFDTFNASQFGQAGNAFDGQQYGAGGELVVNVFQLHELFIDAFGGARIDQYHVTNTQSATSGNAGFGSAYLGLRAQRTRQTSSLSSEISAGYAVADAGSGEINNLGRTPADPDYFVARGDVAATLFLEPLLARLTHSNFTHLASEVAFSASGQLVGDRDRVIPQEEGIIGGLYTVRGYPESIADGDDFAVMSIEYRCHIPRGLSVRPTPGTLFGDTFRYAPQHPFEQPDWDLAPKVFLDAGWTSHNRIQSNEVNASLLSTGIGLNAAFLQNVSLQLDYGFALKAYDAPAGEQSVSAGSSRLHFALTVQY